VSQRIALYGVPLWWNPDSAVPWYLKGGLGLLQYRASTEDPNDDSLTGSADALQVGGGYDIRAARALWLTPFANLIVSAAAILRAETRSSPMPAIRCSSSAQD
jgi:hypothetical protein